jgi:TetR/AcrR family transcriptional repressor of nem operon
MNAKLVTQGPGRPRAFDEAETLDKLVILFWERGYDRVNQQAMAEATGLSTSSLYNAFGTKAETYDKVLEHYASSADALFEPLEHGTRGIDDLEAFLDRFEAQMRTPLGAYGCLFHTSMVVLAGRDDLAVEHAAQHRRRGRAALESALTRARELGEAVPDPVATSTLLVATFQGILAIARATSAGPEIFEQIDAARGLISSWR